MIQDIFRLFGVVPIHPDEVDARRGHLIGIGSMGRYAGFACSLPPIILCDACWK
jgi:hypothetical protein